MHDVFPIQVFELLFLRIADTTKHAVCDKNIVLIDNANDQHRSSGVASHTRNNCRSEFGLWSDHLATALTATLRCPVRRR